MMLNNPLVRATVLGALIAMTAACHSDDKGTPASGKVADKVKVENVYARAVPPGQSASGAFMTLTNTGKEAHSLVSAASPVANTVELHTHLNNNGVMEMRQVPKIDLPAGAPVELKPGSFHVMLIGLKQAMKAGDSTKITLTFDDGSSTTVDAPIKDATSPAGAGNMGGMMHP